MFEYVIGHRRLSHVIRNRFRPADSPLEAEEPIILKAARRGRETIIFVPELCGARPSILSSPFDAAFSISQAPAARQLRVSHVSIWINGGWVWQFGSFDRSLNA